VRIYSFPAVVGNDARILILGSMPGVASLDAVQYYAHLRNQFWSIIARITDTSPALAYEARLDVLRARRFALWDVLHSCVRPGSLDASIEHRSAKPNDLMGLLRRTGTIDRICCNGGTAYAALKRHFGERLAREFPRIEICPLPSTSPANASWSYARKLTAWTRALVVNDLAVSDLQDTVADLLGQH
jgi:TDG/mug DNA glycosylase family protein